MTSQADGTAWMAFFCVVMLDIALELSLYDTAYQDMASKFFEHFIMIADAMNAAGNGEGTSPPHVYKISIWWSCVTRTLQPFDRAYLFELSDDIFV